ncbi:protein DEK [Denticeps clupeoides]|uniref:Protein DEK n=1 Tax=Denticeps clupeoides TaxID=299321 RepID=A0AAY4B8C3_9TELE|nr:protein DEK [Denticeps clupeoides]
MSADAGKETDMADQAPAGGDGEADRRAGRPRAQRPKLGLYEAEIIEGKREKKTVQRLDVQLGKPKERLKIENGVGEKLGDIAQVNLNIGKFKAVLLKPLHKILFDRPGAASSMKKNLRLFNGFLFEVDSEPYNRKKKILMKYTNSVLRTICQVLNIERSGKQCILIDRIMSFLMQPVNTRKSVPVRKKKKKSTAKDTKRKVNKDSQSPRKPKLVGKSKAIVTDSSSDDDEEEEEDKPEKKEANKSSVQEWKIESSENTSEEEGSESDDEEDKDGDNEKPKVAQKKKPGVLKKAAASKKTERSAKKAAPSKRKPAAKKADEEKSGLSDDDDDDHGNDSELEKSNKKVVSKKPAKPVAKTKKADSSSNKSTNKCKPIQEPEDSSDDNEPLIKMIKKPPSDDQIKNTVKDLLKEANLEEVTMKQICKKVYDMYPDFDLTSRKEYIKNTVKSLIT